MAEEMKSIEEAAKDFSLCALMYYEAEKELNGEVDIEEFSSECFKEGIEFAQRWIPVVEELPEPISPPNGIIDNKDLLILKYIKHDSYEFGVLIQDSVGGKYWVIPDYGVFEINEVSHWRPIELK